MLAECRQQLCLLLALCRIEQPRTYVCPSSEWIATRLLGRLRLSILYNIYIRYLEGVGF